MTYKEFYIWCSKRAHDGCWGYSEAVCCLTIIDEIKKLPFWKREKKWKEYECEVVMQIVEPTNNKIREALARNRRAGDD